MKKLIFSTLIALIAVVASASINIDKGTAVKYNRGKVNRFAVTYYHKCSVYILNIPPGSCVQISTLPCTITYPTSQGAQFPDTSIPAGGTPSTVKGCYQ